MTRLLSLLRRLFGVDRDTYASDDTLREIQRADLRQGWDRDAHHCGPWQGACVTDAARTLKWVEK